jgi:hypothetical protein
LVKEEHGKISYKPSSPSAIFIRCDVSKSGKLCEASPHMTLLPDASEFGDDTLVVVV